MIPQDPLEYLASLKGMGIRLGLGPVRRLLKRLGNPQRRFGSVIVGGTNGKGSISSALASILSRGGYRTGLYTSPHLLEFNERIRVDGRAISREELCGAVDEVRQRVEEEVTYFEFATVLSFLHFARSRVDWAVLEVGMGGRLDATNVVDAEVSVISNVSLEHREYLGDRLADIAGEKAGIIREKGRVVTAAAQKAVLEVLESAAREKRARIFRVGRDIRVRAAGGDGFSYRGLRRSFSRLPLPLRGRHQMINAACALGAVELLGEAGVVLDDRAVAEGLSRWRWEGRLEVLRHRPTVIVDGAHNPAGASALRRALKDHFPGRRTILVFGVLADKDYRAMLARLAPAADAILLTSPAEERALPALSLADAAAFRGKPVEVIPDSGQALRRALAFAGEEDLVCVTGSLYLVAEIKNMFSNRLPTPPDGR